MKSRITLLVALVVMVALASAAALADDFDNDGFGGGGSGGAMCGKLSRTAHLTMTELRPTTSNDIERAQTIVETMREKLAKYKDYKVAIADGYEPYAPGATGPIVHFANREATVAEYEGDFELDRPGSLLYEKGTFWGYKLVGAMYSAPTADTPEQLDKLIPLGIARWHAHTNICLPAGITEQDVINGNFGQANFGQRAARVDVPPVGREGFSNGLGNDSLRARFGFMADPRFGFHGLIDTEAECDAVHGNFHPQIFAWMVHIYPFGTDDLKVAFSTDPP